MTFTQVYDLFRLLRLLVFPSVLLSSYFSPDGWNVSKILMDFISHKEVSSYARRNNEFTSETGGGGGGPG
jgi:hypothetical protein